MGQSRRRPPPALRGFPNPRPPSPSRAPPLPPHPPPPPVPPHDPPPSLAECSRSSGLPTPRYTQRRAPPAEPGVRHAVSPGGGARDPRGRSRCARLDQAPAAGGRHRLHCHGGLRTAGGCLRVSFGG